MLPFIWNRTTLCHCTRLCKQSKCSKRFHSNKKLDKHCYRGLTLKSWLSSSATDTRL